MRFWPKSESRAKLPTAKDAPISADPGQRQDQIRERAYWQAVVNAEATAAVQSVLFWWERSFAASSVMPASLATDALLPHMGMVGRALLARGQCVFLISATGRGLSLVPVSSWDIQGGRDPASWRYRVSLAGPSTYATFNDIEADSVLHFRIGVDPSAPWRGRSPLKEARLSANLGAAVEAALSEEMKVPVARVIAIDSFAREQADKRANRVIDGGIFVTSGSQVGDRANAPAPQTKIQPDPSAELVKVRESTAGQIFSVSGVPLEFSVQSGGEGTANRAAVARFLNWTLIPVGRIVASEIAAKLDAPGAGLSFDALVATDVLQQARAVRSLQQAGATLASAAAAVGIDGLEMRPEPAS